MTSTLQFLSGFDVNKYNDSQLHKDTLAPGDESGHIKHISINTLYIISV